MEIYLSHMVVFRGLERLHLLPMNLLSDIVSYLLCVVFVFGATVLFSASMKALIDRLLVKWN